LSQRILGAGAQDFSVDVGALDGTTEKDSPDITFEQNLNDAGWQKDMIVTGVNIRPGSKIDSISQNGLTATLTKPALESSKQGSKQRLAAHMGYQSGVTKIESNELAFSVSVIDRGWGVGMPLSGVNIVPGTVIQAISPNGLGVLASQDLMSGGTYEIVADVNSLPGTTRKGTLSVTFDTDVRGSGWVAGRHIKGPHLAADTQIKEISRNGREIVISQAAIESGLQSLTVQDTETGAMVPSKKIRFAVDVRGLRWAVGMPVSPATPIAHDSKIIGISADGRIVALSQTALADATVDLQIAIVSEFNATLPHALNPSLPGFSPGVVATEAAPYSDTVTILSDGMPAAVGTIQWTGFVLANGDFSLRGGVASGVTGQTVGQIWLKGNGDKYIRGTNGSVGGLIVHYPDRLVSRLNDDVASANYWEALPACDSVTAGQKQSTIDAIGLQNQFQTFFR
jgi:hypothetical protein